MNQDQENRLSRLRTVQAICLEFSDAYASKPAIIAALTHLGTNIDGVETRLGIQSKPTKGVTRNKAQLRAILEDETRHICGHLWGCGADLSDETLMYAITLPPSRFGRISGHRVAGIAKSVLDLARLHETALAAYDYTSANIDDFEAMLESFKGANGNPRKAIDLRATATEEIPELLRQGEDIIHIQLPLLLSPFRRTHKDFFLTFQRARKKINYGKRYEKKSDPTDTSVVA